MPANLIGSTIGPYRIAAKLGEGGMGVGVRSHGREPEIGRQLDAPARGLLAAELASRLKRYRDGGSS